MHGLLAQVELADPSAGARAWKRLERLLGVSSDSQALSALLRALPGTANPDRALLYLDRLAAVMPEPRELRSVLEDPRSADALATLFASSQFLGEVLLRHPEYVRWLVRPRRLAREKAPDALLAEARAEVGACPTHADRLDALRRFQRRELLRIGACDLLGLWDLSVVTAELSRLADCLVQVSLEVVQAEVGASAEGLSVIALGKLGGQELNYSSDIDLLFISAADGLGHERLAELLVEALARVTGEGFLYRVDLRLRPWGQVGPLVCSAAGYLRYLRQHARLWERQALLKARPVAGDRSAAAAFLQEATPLLFAATPEAIRRDVHEMKLRIEAELRRRGREWGEVKLGSGSIRDIEFVVQYLQLAHGARHPSVCTGNTLEALVRLSRLGLLPADDYRALADGLVFLRALEHYLQLMHHRQTHSLPPDARELAYLARRLGFQGPDAGSRLLARYSEHAAAVRAVYQSYLEREEAEMPADPQATSPDPEVQRHLARMDPAYAEAFEAAEIARHAALADRLGDGNLVEVEAEPLDEGAWRVTVVAYDYPGELSAICGLLFVYGFSIHRGQAFTYEPAAPTVLSDAAGRGPAARAAHQRARRKIVDVFEVRRVFGEATEDLWVRYAADLSDLLRRLEAGRQREAQGELAKRAAATLRQQAGPSTLLYPVDIEIDNEASIGYTVLRIDAPDTPGFLYEFTTALALNGMHIARVVIDSVGSRARDTVYLTDTRGRKITSPEKQRELRAATVLVKHFTRLLPHSPNPESALLHFHELLGQLFGQPDWPAELASLHRPEVLSALARLLGVSDFLWDDFLRMQHANLFPVVRDVDALAIAKSREVLRAELAEALRAAPDGHARRDALNDFKDREMFRADMRHILAHSLDLSQFSGELTDVAEVVVEAACQLCDKELRAQYGVPCREDGRPSRLSVCALGKCGGRELGFASDIELMFIYEGGGRTTGPQVVATAEYYEALVREFVGTIRARREGIFEIDLQLRPYGKAGSMAVSLDSFRRYFAPGGPAWDYERQALVKLRPIAGDPELGGEVAALRDLFIYSGEPFNVAAMRAMRERQLRHHVAGGTINAKYSRGGLVDAEYLVQALQIRYGSRDPRVRLTNTRLAIEALAEVGALGPEDRHRLRDAYAFLRQLIDALRMVRGNARDLTVPPAGSEEFAFLARRLGYQGDPARLSEDLRRHMGAVHELSLRLLA
ncbi:MAG: glutamine synthetase adenylyltransferase [Anaerolineae bacterium]|nr:glutamine synthetase adenylyltransferase [Anaerolineae bacterium]